MKTHLVPKRIYPYSLFMCIYVWRPETGVRSFLTVLLLRHEPSVNQQLTNAAYLTSQLDPGIPSLP